MSENGVQAGSVSRVGDIFEARLERLFDHDRDAVWHMITEPDALVQCGSHPDPSNCEKAALFVSILPIAG